MLDFLNPSLGEIPEADASMIKAISGQVGKYMLLNDVANAGLSRFSGGSDLENQARRLDVLIKKRQLGLPLDDDEYEGLINEDTHPLIRAGVASLMTTTPRPTIMKPHFKTAYAAGGTDLPGVLDAFKEGITHGTGSRTGSNVTTKLAKLLARR